MPVVEISKVAGRLGVDVASLTSAQTTIMTERIEDSQGKVEGYLERSLVPTVTTITDMYPTYGHMLDDIDAWPGVSWPDFYEVTDFVPAVSGKSSAYDVTFNIGIDLNDVRYRPIMRFLLQDIEEALRIDPGFAPALGGRKTKQVSADGQSVTYEETEKTEDAGGKLTLASLNKWRRRSAYQAPSRPLPPFPYA